MNAGDGDSRYDEGIGFVESLFWRAKSIFIMMVEEKRVCQMLVRRAK